MSSDEAARGQPAMEQVAKSCCSLCWEDFNEPRDLDDHIRSSHPDRISRQEELFARRAVA